MFIVPHCVIFYNVGEFSLKEKGIGRQNHKYMHAKQCTNSIQYLCLCKSQLSANKINVICILFLFQDTVLWACLATMAAYAKDLNTAETAYAAIDEVCNKPFVTLQRMCFQLVNDIQQLRKGLTIR